MSELIERLRAGAPWTVHTERDLTYFRVNDDEVIVVACDSDGGLGPKPHDTVPVDGEVLGRFATRVPLLECVAAGASPLVVVDTLSVELEPTGQPIIAGVVAEAESAGVPRESVTGSTEDNVPTVATGVGVTVIGRAALDGLRVGVARPPFAVVLLGRPMSAPADIFGPDHPDIVSVPRLVAALAIDGVVEALPIGSSGVANEFEALAHTAGGRSEMSDDWPCDRDQSGGPSTAVLLAVEPDRVDRVLDDLAGVGCPAWLLGRVV
jgi:selenophosphate synthetase-related protein